MTTADPLIEAIRSWKGTPYHHRARIKGVGVDCGQVIIAAHVESGMVEDFDTGSYPYDWHLHRGQDRYLGFVERHLRRIDSTELSIDARLATVATYSVPAGSVIVFKLGRTFSHGAMVTSWPNVVHSYLPSGMVEEISLINTPLAKRSCRVYIHPDLLS